jgi:hypothetical protein
MLSSVEVAHWGPFDGGLSCPWEETKILPSVLSKPLLSGSSDYLALHGVEVVLFSSGTHDELARSLENAYLKVAFFRRVEYLVRRVGGGVRGRP